MPFRVIDYKSGTISIYGLRRMDHNSDSALGGLSWIAGCLIRPEINTHDHYVCLYWDFKWNVQSEIVGFNGYIQFTWKTNRNENHDEELPVKLRPGKQSIERKLQIGRHENIYFSYKIFLVPVLADRDVIREKFVEAKDDTDAVLVVDGKKLHVNKACLSYYSDYFKTLFNSDFKERSMNEIPIRDVDFDDLARFLSIIHRDPTFPTVKTSPILLELADRYIMPVVTKNIENFLILANWRGMNVAEVIYLADKYKLEKLLEHAVNSIDHQRIIEDITKTKEYKNMEYETKAKLYHRLLQIKDQSRHMVLSVPRKRPVQRANQIFFVSY